MRNPSGARLPDFIGIGPPRTGTTWLHNALGGVAVLPRGTKETHFFAERYENGIQWYANHFRHGAEGLPTGEFDPNFFNLHAMERIRADLPKCRLICTIRDPVERAYSMYKHMRRMGRAGPDFEGWLPEMKDGNRYASHLRLWRERFPSEQILITFYDELVTDPGRYLDTVCDFIGARQVELATVGFDDAARNHVQASPLHAGMALLVSNFRHRLQNRRAYAVTAFLSRVGFWKLFFEGGAPFLPLSAEVEARARKRFLPEVEALEETLGRDLGAWKGKVR